MENIFENSDFILLLNQASGDREILAKKLNISPHQLSYVTQSGEGEGLMIYGEIILPFYDKFPKDTELYKIMTSKPQEMMDAPKTAPTTEVPDAEPEPAPEEQQAQAAYEE